MAPLGPEPDIVGKLENLNFSLCFLNLYNLSEALISEIFFLSKFFSAKINILLKQYHHKYVLISYF